MIRFEDIHKAYGNTAVLGPLTGGFQPGAVTALIGPNGAGKSTLLTIIGRLLDPTSGTVILDDTAIHSIKSRELARRLAILRQENSITARLTVRDLVGFGRFPHSQGRLTDADRAAVDRALSFLELTALADRYTDQLSGGQRQRAYVAMVLAQDTEYILLDEPLNNLDLKHQVSMMRRLRRACDELGKTIVVVIHDINFAAAYSDHIIALKDGRIARAGTPAEIMRREVLEEIFDTTIEVHDVGTQRVAVYAGL